MKAIAPSWRQAAHSAIFRKYSPREAPVDPQQLDLFSGSISFTPASRPETLLMDCDALTRWKSQIATHQKQARDCQPVQQGTLFDITPVHCDPEAVDPFSLRLHSMSFYRLPTEGSGQSCLYFVLDTAAELVLYVGETCSSNLRWKGEHDCKRYLDNYASLHYQHRLKTTVSMAFWWDAPVQTRARQQLELSLILKWRSPFNVQNWTFWGTPFVG